jgi:hypothetical protein
MSRRIFSAALVLTLCSQVPEALASSCIYDKDCPGGYVLLNHQQAEDIPTFLVVANDMPASQPAGGLTLSF